MNPQAKLKGFSSKKATSSYILATTEHSTNAYTYASFPTKAA